ncbi:holo-(acyl carrier protein) synthase 2 [Pedobacter glucosidilyticus]|nr:4'-phosphopantetheinyl transferase superfamily protein [Pedobacter glucosidilyticus]KHJ36595.1 holo-(acyl carrier protein) synthase 2 [Pedobacter glucosidilyticus]
MPLTFLEEIHPNTYIGLWKIEEEPAVLEKQLQLKDHEKEVLKGLNTQKRNLHWLATRVLLRKMLNTEEYIDCQPDENGKPVLLNMPHHISLSHSYDYAAVIISKDKRVGIDIEIIKDKITRVQQKFMSPQELSFMDEQYAIEHLYVCWCAKEALYKLNGKKETSFKDDIHLEEFPYQTKGVLKGSIHKEPLAKNYKIAYRKFEDYMLGYVYEEDEE